MPHSVSAKKALRTNVRNRQRNKSAKSRISAETRKFERALERGDVEGARKQLSLVTKLLQRGAAKGVIQSSAAARKQSRLCKSLEKAKASAK